LQAADSLLWLGLLVVLVMLPAVWSSGHAPVLSISAPAHRASQALPNVFFPLQHTGAYSLAHEHGFLLLLLLSVLMVSALTVP
jgi:hypothetical protein